MMLGRRCISFMGAACVVVAGCLSSAPVTVGSVDLPACDAKFATIEHVRLLSFSAAGASFEAQINPEGTETGYEFVILGRQVHASESPERLSAPVQDGRLAAGTSAVPVTVLSSGLQSGYIYWLEVVATNLAGKTRSTPSAYFYDDPSAEVEPLSNPWPYRTDPSGCAIESGKLGAEETVREQREKEALQTRAAEEAARKRQAEEVESQHSHIKPNCVVPNLRGDTLRIARRRISAAHCSLGSVTWPRIHRGRVVVVRQTPRRGRHLRDGARVSLVLRSH
jgi:hypothetical protein